jgi:hypothetical protein
VGFNLEPPKDLTNLFRVWVDTNRLILALSDLCVGQVQSFGLFGYLETMIFFYKNDYTLICRLFLGQLIGPVSRTLCRRRATCLGNIHQDRWSSMKRLSI